MTYVAGQGKPWPFVNGWQCPGIALCLPSNMKKLRLPSQGLTSQGLTVLRAGRGRSPTWMAKSRRKPTKGQAKPFEPPAGRSGRHP